MITEAYLLLERRFPPRLKRLIPQRWRIWLGYQIKVVWGPSPVRAARTAGIELVRPLSVPAEESEQTLWDYLSQFYIKEDGVMQERTDYLTEAFRRLLYTLQMIPNASGRLLEIGAAPYFMSLLLRQFTSYELALVNYFGEAWGKRASQTLVAKDGSETRLEFDNVNVEAERLPFDTASFDVVLLCEVLEHFTNDPCFALLEIKRVLRPGGVLILTTPNVARLDNVICLLAGNNISDAYSAYGPPGRHNREYTLQEIGLLLDHVGFTVEQAFTSDTSPHSPASLPSTSGVQDALLARSDTLGQYTFIRANSSHAPNLERPRWLYRSYPDGQLAKPDESPSRIPPDQPGTVTSVSRSLQSR